MLSKIEFKVSSSEPREYSIYVKVDDGKFITIEVNCLNTVKGIINTQNISHDDKVISFNRKHLDDDKSMEELDITEHSMLNLMRKANSYNVKVLPDKMLRLDASSLATVANFKKKIEEQEGIPGRNKQRLYFEGRELRNYEAALKYIVQQAADSMILFSSENFSR